MLWYISVFHRSRISYIILWTVSGRAVTIVCRADLTTVQSQVTEPNVSTYSFIHSSIIYSFMYLYVIAVAVKLNQTQQQQATFYKPLTDPHLSISHSVFKYARASACPARRLHNAKTTAPRIRLCSSYEATQPPYPRGDCRDWRGLPLASHALPVSWTNQCLFSLGCWQRSAVLSHSACSALKRYHANSEQPRKNNVNAGLKRRLFYKQPNTKIYKYI